MYQVYIKVETAFESKKLIGEYSDYDNATEKVEEVLAKDKDIKYIIEETSGHVDSYGNLTANVIDEN